MGRCSNVAFFVSGWGLLASISFRLFKVIFLILGLIATFILTTCNSNYGSFEEREALPTLDQVYFISLYDEDLTSGNDFVGQVDFNPSNKRVEKPASIELSNSIMRVRVYLSLE